jgi:SAM-dependent methyltransferase
LSDELKVMAVYDTRFGTMQLNVDSIVRLKLRDLIESLNIPPAELAALLDDKYEWTEGDANIEPARLRMLCETDSTGKTVIDCGGYDGAAAKQLLDQGASRAICLDNQQYEHYGWDDKRFPGVEYVKGDFIDILDDDTREELLAEGLHPPLLEIPAQYDIVVFWNVLYHLRNPWRALNKIREITKPTGEMLLCTLFRYHKGAWVYLYEPRECNPTDDTVYFGFSLEALERLLTATGWTFTQEGLAYDRVVYRCKPAEGWQRTHEDT